MRVRTARPGIRLLLLITVVLGLGWMHTIGHHGGGHEALHQTGHTAPAHAVGHTPVQVADHVEVVTAGALIAPLGELDGPAAELCLAILAAAVVLAALVAVRIRRTAGDPHGPHDPRGLFTVGRGPPRLTPPGLIIADLTVLRI